MEIKFLLLEKNEEIVVQASQKQSILQALLNIDFPIDHSCGGNGSCGTCRIEIIEGLENLSPPNEVEQEMIADRGFRKGERLSCQNLSKHGLKIKISK
jgi:ferredoxin, 2Fe-2S